MTLKMIVAPPLEERLKQEALRQGLSVNDFVLELLEKELTPEDRRTELIGLLQSWIDDGDPDEQRETGNYLIRALDEDRLSDRELFPAELEGVTW